MSRDSSDDPIDRTLDRLDATPENPGDKYTAGQDDMGPDIPSIDPTEHEFSYTDADPELTRTFVIAVVLTNVGLLAISLGLMFAYFEGRTQLGGILVVVGVFAIVRMYQRYRAFRSNRKEADRSETS